MEYAHSVEREEELRSIALYGLYRDSSIEPASVKNYAVGTIRIIFNGSPRGRQVARSFAQDMPFTKTTETSNPNTITRIEVDISNLRDPPKSEDELAAWYDELVTKYGGESFIPPNIWKMIGRELDRFQETGINNKNWLSKIKEALSGTSAANVPVIAIDLSEA